MSDAELAGVARGLAQALMRFGKSREPGDKQEVLRLETELCAAVRAEAVEEREHAHATVEPS